MFALLDRQSFARADGSVSSSAPSTTSSAPSATSSVTASVIPAARRATAVPGALFTPAGGTPIPAPSDDLAVLVVDGDPQRREVLTRSLSTVGVSSLAEASTSHEARQHARSEHCDLAVVDLALPGGDALDLVGDLRDRGWRTVVLGDADSASTAREAFQAGALAYLLTSSSGVITPGAGTPPRPREPGSSGGAGRDPGDLSAREVQVLQCVADGRSNAEIGEELSLSALTVKSHLSRIGRKLGTGDRAGMVALAMRADLVR